MTRLLRRCTEADDMIHSASGVTPVARRASPPHWRRWREWVAYAAAGWSLVYGALGLYWARGGAGFPFGNANDPNAAESILQGARASSGGPVIAVLGLVGALVAIIMSRPPTGGIGRWVLIAFAWSAAAMLLVVIPDRRLLLATAYLPLFIVGAPFGWPPVSFFDAIPWPVVNQLILVGGGILWAATGFAYADRPPDGRATAAPSSGWTTPQAAAGWGKWAGAVAVAIPVVYAATRWLWALGIPLGISDEFLREGQASGLWIAGAGLATVAVGGAILTLGLVQRWGEVFPRWIPGLAGKRVPPALAIVPATAVSIIVTAAGISYVRLFVNLGMPLGEWTTIGPELLWPLWGISLALATLAYHLRRRGQSAAGTSFRSEHGPG